MQRQWSNRTICGCSRRLRHWTRQKYASSKHLNKKPCMNTRTLQKNISPRCSTRVGRSDKHHATSSKCPDNATKMGIDFNCWSSNVEHRLARNTRRAWRVCYRSRVSASPRFKSWQGVQEFHARLFARLGRERAAVAKISMTGQRILL